ncbi:mediator of RNA polymerase II transcription subunit 18-like [Homarus americanus]|uniref:Mediator of RNA polymerase II transcription subunit 18 n=1 Tax=Homarus americanus TaxID=6706 RepID=A0A8J5JJV4_HOMAM|nr:mediator of RNA polymerase II transcription subunit 18-like [Homarus americanus]XP_042240322.1 mediator of RNA polymerase II transcription subunit 18-like [Homarus americanus]XP_042240323.1 mediator of RNA polymerase II transcription subunit 18-like [Homarus americanus]XP_042240326.1 mediator of RNA polymerase II transcription subunit 18-like [Homarus americanus]KAG7158671.1 Mediator of RNA polymerase II transcription subunit 18-like [Homarus americanus]
MALPVNIPHAGETIESALKNQIVPDQEFLLQGSVLDTSLPVVIDRLRGLCDNADIPPETFHDHEVVYILKDFNAPATPGPAGQGVMLRVRRAVDHPELPYQLRYVGYPEIGNYPAVLRNCLDVPVSSNVCEFLQELGAKLDHEFMAKGYIMKKGRIKVTIFKMYKIGAGMSKDNLEAMTMSHLVELSVLTTKTDMTVAEDLRNLADQLKPLVQLERLDYRRLGPP